MAPVADVSAIAGLSSRFRPAHLRALEIVAPGSGVNLFVDRGDLAAGQPEQETGKLLEYVRLGLALPDSCFWVNLRPDSPDNVLDPRLENTDAGRILLEADLQLKKDFSLCTSPDTAEGKKYWEQLYARAEQICPGIPMSTIVRPWIVPGEIILGTNARGVFIYKATLKVMLEQDYIKDASAYKFDDPRLKEINAYSAELMRSMVLPMMDKAVNSSRKYAQLRQLFYSLIIAQWYKQQEKKTPCRLFPAIDNGDLNGLSSKTPWSAKNYYKAYQDSFNKGEYFSSQTRYEGGASSRRSYSSGGIMLDGGAAFEELNSRQFLAGLAVPIEKIYVGEDGVSSPVAKEKPVSAEEMKAVVREAAESVTRIQPMLDNIDYDALKGWYEYCRGERRKMLRSLYADSLRKEGVVTRLDQLPIATLLVLYEEFNRDTGRPLASDLTPDAAPRRHDAILSNRFVNVCALSLLAAVTLVPYAAAAGDTVPWVDMSDVVGPDVTEIAGNVTHSVDLDTLFSGNTSDAPSANRTYTPEAIAGDTASQGHSYEEYAAAKEKLLRADVERSYSMAMGEEALAKFDAEVAQARKVVSEYEAAATPTATVTPVKTAPTVEPAVSKISKEGFDEYNNAKDKLIRAENERVVQQDMVEQGRMPLDYLKRFDAEIEAAREIVREFETAHPAFASTAADSADASAHQDAASPLELRGDINAQMQSAVTYQGENTLQISMTEKQFRKVRDGSVLMRFESADVGDAKTLVLIVKGSAGVNTINLLFGNGSDMTVKKIVVTDEWQTVYVPLEGFEGAVEYVGLQMGDTVSFNGDIYLAGMDFVEGDTSAAPLADLIAMRNALDDSLQEYRAMYGDFDFNNPAHRDPSGPGNLCMSIYQSYKMEAQKAAANGDVARYMEAGNAVDALLPQDASFFAAEWYGVYLSRFQSARDEAEMYDVSDFAEINYKVTKALSSYESDYGSSYYTDEKRIALKNERGYGELSWFDYEFGSENLLFDGKPLSGQISAEQYDDLQAICRLHELHANSFVGNSAQNIQAFAEAGHDLEELMSDDFHGQRTALTQDAHLGDMPFDWAPIITTSMLGFSLVLLSMTGPAAVNNGIHNLLQRADDKQLASALGLHIVVARYLKNDHRGIYKLAQPGFRGDINYMISMVGKEQTADYREQRIDIDAKLELLRWFFAGGNLEKGREAFDLFFKNHPDKYRLDNDMLAEIEKSGLLGYIGLKDLRYLIRAINADPRKTVESVMENIEGEVRARFESNDERERVLKNMRWLVWNFYVLGRSFSALESLTQEEGVTELNLVGLLKELNAAGTYDAIAQLAHRNNVRESALIRTKLGIMPWFQACDLMAGTLSRLPELSENERTEIAGVIFSVMEEMNAVGRLQLMVRLVQGIGYSEMAPIEIMRRLLEQFDEETVVALQEQSGVSREILLAIGFLADHMDSARKAQLLAILSVDNVNLSAEKKLEILDAFANAVEDAEAKKQQGKKKGDGRASIDALLKERNELKEIWQDFRGMAAWVKEEVDMVSENRIPHAYLATLLRIAQFPDGAIDHAALEAFRRFITTKKNRDADADSKNALLNELQAFSQFEIAIPYQGRINKANIFRGILQLLSDKESAATLKDMDPARMDTLRVMVKNFHSVMDIYGKVRDGASLFNEDSAAFSRIRELSDELLEDIIVEPGEKGRKPRFDTEKFEALTELMKAYYARDLLASFSGVQGVDIAEDTESRLQEFILAGGLSRRDHEGNDLFMLINAYLGNKSKRKNAEIYQLMWKALFAEMKGSFGEYKYSSPDVSAVLRRTAMTLLSAEQRKKFLTGAEDAQTRDLLERMRSDPAYERQVAAVDAIDRLWRQDQKYMATINGEHYSVEITGDFFDLLTIGNSHYFASCQNVFGGWLNKGLMGYVHNGTVKAVIVRNRQGEVVTRRIIRLMTAPDEQGVERPIIFVENNRQFNSRGIDEIFDSLRMLSSEMSEQSGIVVPIAVPSKAAAKVRISVPHGRSAYGYSDFFGSQLHSIGAGMYRQTKDATVEVAVKYIVPESGRQYGLDRIVDGKVYRQLLDMSARLFYDGSVEEVLEAENDPDQSMIKVIDPSAKLIGELKGRGYFLRPGKIGYQMEVPAIDSGENFMAEYLATIRGTHKRYIKRIAEGIENGTYLLVEDTGNNLEYTRQYIEFNTEQMAGMERGRQHLRAAVQKYDGDVAKFIANDRMGLYLVDAASGKMLGGIIVKKGRDHFDIGYEATLKARDHGAEGDLRVPRNISDYLKMEMIRKTRANNWTKLSKGIDENLYGYHLAGTLAQAKANANYKPRVPANAVNELIKITDYSDFNMPVFLYTYGDKGGLESTLIIDGETPVEVIDGYRGITDTLNVYVLQADNSLRPWDGKTVKTDEAAAGEVARDGGKTTPAAAPGGIDFRRLPVGGRTGVPALMPLPQQTLLNIAAGSRIKDTEKEWRSIRREMLRSEIRYSRLRELLAVSLVKGDTRQVTNVVSCIMNILRTEESAAEPTPRQIKELIALM